MFSSSTVSVGDSFKNSYFDQLIANDNWNKGRLDTVYSGTTAFVGAKSFTDIRTSTHSIRPKLPGIDSNTSTSGVSVQVQYVNLSATVSLKRVYKEIMEIGPWNMDVTEERNIAHNLPDAAKIRHLSAIVRTDDNTEFIPLTFCDASGVMGGRVARYTLNMNVWRLGGGVFDNNANFTSTSFNRGWITIEYEE